jgi:hypothetical protein
VRARISNTGRSTWLRSGASPGGVALGVHLFRGDGSVIRWDHHWENLTNPPRPLEPGETVEISFPLPPLEPGAYRLELDCVADRITWFKQLGTKSVTLDLDVT